MAGLDLAAIGNCTVASLIVPDGRHVWFCFPRLDADPVFHALFSGEARARGLMGAALRDQHTGRQCYLENTAIVATELADSGGGKIHIIDFCPRFRPHGRIFRPPMIVRRIEPLAGRPRLTICLRPGFDYGAAAPGLGFGSNHLRFIGPHTELRLTTDMPLLYRARSRGGCLIGQSISSSVPTTRCPKIPARWRGNSSTKPCDNGSTGCAISTSRSTGRMRTCAPQSHSSSAATMTPGASSPR